MATQDAAFWTKITATRQELKKRFEADSNVTLIDIGYAPTACHTSDQIVLRIHVRADLPAERRRSATTFPADVNGISVCIMPSSGHPKP